MSFQVSWQERDAEGKRYQVEVQLVGNALTWKRKVTRYEPRTPFQPAPEDWEALLATLRRNLGRGKVYPEDLRSVERLRREADG